MNLSKFFSYEYSFQKVVICLLAAFVVTLTACGGMEEEESAVSILEDGKISSLIVEQFDKNYYDQEELQQRILQEASDYNSVAGEGAVSVEKVTVDDGVISVGLTYAGAEHYAAFNDGIFFVGSVEQAQEAGYSLRTTLSSTADSTETIGRDDILAMADVQILITDMKDPVVLNGQAAYISSNVLVSDKLKTVYFEETSEELAYVIYN